MKMYTPPRLQRLGFGLCLAGMFFLVGCGASKTKVTGKVTLAGKALVFGSVTLVDGTGMYHQGDIGLDGSYSIEGVPTGPVKIGVFSPNPHAQARGADKGKSAPDPNDPREKFIASQGGKKDAGPPKQLPPAGAWFPIDNKYTDPANSGLTGTVAKDTPLNIDIPQ